ncbi:cytochrome-c peroxidase [Aquimarina aquimarini]|uniref:cytochrome-c peroxidase n=1 Tax=Aquimarina aquimarini TaxID=1191734 RepID=UPI000D554CFB|nr:cytochrome c peroxidase [Aquimarina aquimarini]
MNIHSNYAYLVSIYWICLLFISCSNDGGNDEVLDTDTYELIQPEGFPEIKYTTQNNPITQKGFELGRKLFFDPRLSADGSISCNNCHQQSRGFADSPVHPMSIGINSQAGNRNAPPLFNMAFRKEFFWDGGVTHLDFVPINALESDIEMGETMKNVVEKLNRNDEYRQLFKEAFDVDSITSPRILQAFSQYMLLMISNDSKYDQYQRQENNVTFTESEQKGMLLFDEKCSSCHSGSLFTDQSFRNNGISDTFSDNGRALITESNSDIGKFRVPTLRNIEVTGPYMHNANFDTLEEVLQHYANGVKNSETLDAMLKTENNQLGIALTESEQADIIAFLKTLTDETFLTDPKFNNPI